MSLHAVAGVYRRELNRVNSSTRLRRNRAKLHSNHSVFTSSAYPLLPDRLTRELEDSMGRFVVGHKSQVALVTALVVLVGAWVVAAPHGESDGRFSDFLRFSAPAGDRPATTDTVDRRRESGRAAERPIGHAGRHRGQRAGAKAVRAGAVARRRDAGHAQQRRRAVLADPDCADSAARTPTVKRIDVNASFMGVTFSPDSRRVYLSGGENGNIWIGDAIAGRIIGSVNLNGPTHPLDRPLDVVAHAATAFQGRVPGQHGAAGDGRYLYVVDQGSFQVHVIDVSKIETGLDAQGRIIEPDNFAAVVGHAKVGRYPFGIALSPDDRTLFVTHVGVFQYTHLRPATPTGRRQRRLPALLSGRRLSRTRRATIA